MSNPSEKDLISVIVPVYKVEPYLDQCVESIVNQTYTNLEIILVDDGSPDNCPAICDAWAAKDERIVVIHKENGGLSDARNAGMAIARGEFISFVDSDDWMDLDYFEVLFGAMRANNAQVGASDVIWAHPAHQEHRTRYKKTFFTPQEALETIMNGDGFFATAWSKLYNASLFEGVSYPVGRLHEDEFVTYKVIAKAQRLVLCQNTAYYYRQRQGSIMASGVGQLDAVDAFLERLDFFRVRFPDLYRADKPAFCVMLAGLYKESLSNRTTNGEEMRDRLRKYRRRIHYSVGEILGYKPKQIIYVLGTGFSLELFCRMLSGRGRKWAH